MANRFTVSTIFAAIDQMSGPMTKMQGSTRKLGQASGMAGDQVKSSGAKIGGALKGIMTGMVAVVGAAVAAGAAVFSLAKQTSNAAGSIRDTAMALGISNKALQEYRYVAELSGMTASDMDEALKKLTVNLGKNSSETQSALAMLGLTIEQFKAAGPDKALELVAQGMQNISDPTARAAVVTQLFGKSSVRMVNALSEGVDGLAALRKEANAVGYVMEDAAVSAGATLGDSLNRLRLTAKGLVNVLGSTFVPIVAKAVDSLQGFMVANRPQIVELISNLTGVFDQLWATIQGILPQVMSTVSTLLAVLGPVLKALLPAIGKIVEAIMPVVTELLSAMAPILVDLANLIGNTIGSLLPTLTPMFKLLISFVKMLMPPLQKVINILARVLEPVMEIMAPLIELMVESLEPLIEILDIVLVPILEVVGDILVWLAKGLKTTLVPAIKMFSNVGAGIRAAFGDVFAWLKGAFQSVGDFFGRVIKGIGGFFTWLWNGIKAGAEAVFSGVKLIFLSIADFILSTYGNVVKVVLDVAAGVGKALGADVAGLKKLTEGITNLQAGVKTELVELKGGGTTPISSQTTTVNNKSTVDVNFNNTPPGTSVKQTGKSAPNVSLNLGKAVMGW